MNFPSTSKFATMQSRLYLYLIPVRRCSSGKKGPGGSQRDAEKLVQQSHDEYMTLPGDFGPKSAKIPVNPKNRRPKIVIGNVSAEIRTPKNAELVPYGYILPENDNTTLKQLKWLIQKDSLRQDVFLIGPPGPAKRRLVMQYLRRLPFAQKALIVSELTGREYEYLALTRDTTEADIKQRREIKDGVAFYTDLCAVRAALHGRVLVLDGIEKAERNVLPILNNLLENREMQLDDGRFLMSHEKYDQLLMEESTEKLRGWGLERVSPAFHVVALGLPTPLFRGHALDPPFRSRFQSLRIQPPPFHQQYTLTAELAPEVTNDKISSVMSFIYGITSEESEGLGIPYFTIDNTPHLAQYWNLYPAHSPSEVVQKFYPYKAMLKQENQEAVEKAFETFGIADKKRKGVNLETALRAEISHIPSPSSTENPHISTVKLMEKYRQKEREVNTFNVPNGILETPKPKSVYIANDYHENVLAEMVMSHAVKDFALIGPKGCGKSVLVDEFARRLNYPILELSMYQDMTGRELIQRRAMNERGETVWEETPLINAILKGHVAVLDGLHKLHHSTVNIIQRLVEDRELVLFDGGRLISRTAYDQMKEKSGMTETELTERGIRPIHPAFRLIGVGESGGYGAVTAKGRAKTNSEWLTPQILGSFMWHQVDQLQPENEALVVGYTIEDVPRTMAQYFWSFLERIRKSPDPNVSPMTLSFCRSSTNRHGPLQYLDPGEVHDSGSFVDKFLISTATSVRQSVDNTANPAFGQTDDQIPGRMSEFGHT